MKNDTNNKVGNAIQLLRKRVGYTQKELADRVGVSDKAVSKWERGLGLPDVGIISKLAIILDTSSDSLLMGDVIQQHNDYCGLILLNNNNDICSQTLIFDKPILQYLLGYMMLLGIRDIYIVEKFSDDAFAQKTKINGKKLGINICYVQSIDDAKNRIVNNNIMVICGKSIIYGVDQTRFFQKAMANRNHITVLSLPKKRMPSYQMLYFDTDRKVVNSEDSAQLLTQYDYYQIPIFFCPSSVFVSRVRDISSTRGMLDDIFENENIYTVTLDRGFVEIPINTWDDVNNASNFVKTVEDACGMKLYCLEEIAWRRGLISKEQFIDLAGKKSNNLEGKYMKILLEG